MLLRWAPGQAGEAAQPLLGLVQMQGLALGWWRELPALAVACSSRSQTHRTPARQCPGVLRRSIKHDWSGTAQETCIQAH